MKITPREIFAGFLTFLLCFSVATAQTVKAPSFDVVSIHPSDPNNYKWNYREYPDRVAITGATVRTLVADAYGKELANVLGGPKWIDSERYDVTATFDESLMAKLHQLSNRDRMDQIFLMLRTVMEQRFGLTTRHETRDAPVYLLVIAKDGPKFDLAPPPKNETEAREVGARYNGHLWKVNREPMSFLAIQLSRYREVGRNVIDQTGLTGEYRFDFDWTSKPDPDESFYTALDEQLGLKLTPAKRPVDYLVIDHIDRPAEN